MRARLGYEYPSQILGAKHGFPTITRQPFRPGMRRQQQQYEPLAVGLCKVEDVFPVAKLRSVKILAVDIATEFQKLRQATRIGAIRPGMCDREGSTGKGRLLGHYLSSYP